MYARNSWSALDLTTLPQKVAAMKVVQNEPDHDISLAVSSSVPLRLRVPDWRNQANETKVRDRHGSGSQLETASLSLSHTLSLSLSLAHI